MTTETVVTSGAVPPSRIPPRRGGTPNPRSKPVALTLSHIKRIKNPQRRAESASKFLTERTNDLDKVRDVRDDAARAMFDAGYTAADVARALGVTRTAVARRFKDKHRAKLASKK